MFLAEGSGIDNIRSLNSKMPIQIPKNAIAAPEIQPYNVYGGKIQYPNFAKTYDVYDKGVDYVKTNALKKIGTAGSVFDSTIKFATPYAYEAVKILHLPEPTK